MRGGGGFFADRPDFCETVVAGCKQSAENRIFAASLSGVALEVRDQIRNLFEVTGADNRDLS